MGSAKHTAAKVDIEQARYNMIEQQIRTWDVLDPHVLSALNEVPREDFTPARYRAMAFVDTHVPLGHGQVMMHPKLEARLLQELALNPTDKVLEIGTGSGYMTALLATLANGVDSVDIFPDFIESAREKLAAHDLTNVSYTEGDAAAGWDTDERYDAVILTGSVPLLADGFCELLKPGGRLVAIVGEEPIMEALLVQRMNDGSLARTSMFDTCLPPLVNAARPPSFVF